MNSLYRTAENNSLIKTYLLNNVTNTYLHKKPARKGEEKKRKHRLNNYLKLS